LLSAGPSLRVERLLSHAVACEWSPVYQTPSARVVFPCNEAALEFRSGASTIFADLLTIVTLSESQPYQLRPFARQARLSVVVSAAAGIPADGSKGAGPAAFAVPANLLYRLRVHWRELETGRGNTDLTAQLLADALARRALGGSSSAVLRARRFLASQGHFATERPLGEVADAACVSPFHLTRAFKRETGWGLHAYRRHLRLSAALARLHQGERDLAGLAHDLGFSSQSHLGAVFLAEVGVTLGQARRALAA
jgi:AraC-like DNA-binding protein